MFFVIFSEQKQPLTAWFPPDRHAWSPLPHLRPDTAGTAGEDGSHGQFLDRLDRLRRALILFADPDEALERFLVEEGIGKDAGSWDLARSLFPHFPPVLPVRWHLR
jgi:hypothetical protein